MLLLSIMDTLVRIFPREYRDRYLKIEHKIYQAIYIYIYNLMKKLDEDEMNKESKNVSTVFAL